MPHVIGITGGIGSGKSAVARYINEHTPFQVYDSDARAKELMISNSEVVQKLKDSFGQEVYLPDGSLNRSGLAQVVFNDEKKLATLNGIVHPAVRKDFEEWKSQSNQPFVFEEAAILIESGAYKHCDKVLLVLADKKIRIQRVMKRDHKSEEQVEERIENQMSDEEKIPYADYIIWNNGTLLELNEKVANWLQELVNEYQ